ncbi:MAG: hypothetical protein CEE40_01185 [Chloroflexi bacterium B3_Chlor]|nr:MAG: hypothetical protein CEE40_01185 [Chloroflexi bacterium B3_Chlor]
MSILGRQRTTRDKAELHRVVMPFLLAMYQEFKDFSKKKPDAALAKNKMGVANRLLEKCRAVLESEASLQFLDLLDEDDVPQNSDVILMLSQYVAAMEQFKETYYGWDGDEDTWFVSD